MEYRRLGRSGLKLSALSFGSWVTFGPQVDVDAAVECMRIAFEAGVNFFDNAETYAQGQSEIIMGKALKKLGWSRDSYCVSSKVFFGVSRDPLPTQKGLSRKHIVDACEQALERLQVDYLDLFFCHRPDPDTPVEETVRAMHDLIARGKVLYWGTSEWPEARIREACEIADRRNLTPPTMEQPQYNMFERKRVEQEYAPLFKDFGIGTTIWSPLYLGVLTNKYADGIPDGSRMTLPQYAWLRERVTGPVGQKRVAAVRDLAKIAESVGTDTTLLALAWCLKNPNVSTVILGASNADQLRHNLGALSVVPRLDAGIMKSIQAVLSRTP